MRPWLKNHQAVRVLSKDADGMGFQRLKFFTLDDLATSSKYALMLREHLLRVLPAYYGQVRSLPVEQLVIDIHLILDKAERFRLTKLVLNRTTPSYKAVFPVLWKSMRTAIILIRHHERKINLEERWYTMDGYVNF